MSTLVVIPARLGSTRLGRKPLRLLAGVPLVVRVWERVRSLRVADRCVIATDSAEIAAAARDAGAESAMTASHHASGTDRVAEVAARDEYRGYDVIVNVQGDEPFVPLAAVVGARDQVARCGFELGTAAVRAEESILQSPDVVKVVCADDGRAMYFSRAAIPFLRDAADASLRDASVWQHIGVYAYAPAALRRWVSLPPHGLERVERLEQLRPLAAGLAMGVALLERSSAPGWDGAGVDTEADLKRANAHWTAFIAGQTHAD